MKTFFAKFDDNRAPHVREGFLLLFMAFATFGLYYPAILAPFCLFDDLGMTIDFLNNPSWAEVKIQVIKGGIYFRPITIGAFFIIYKMFGLAPEPFHLFSVMLHFFCGLLLYFIIKKMYNTFASGIWLAFTGAMIFLLHPVNVEAVAWISGRTAVVVTFFVLLTFYFHLLAQEDLKDWRLWAAALCYLFSLLSYELALAMPLVFAYWDIEQRNLHGWRKIIRTCYPRWLPYFFMLIAYIALRMASGIGKHAPDGGASLLFFGFLESFINHFSSPFVALGFYVKKLFWPWPLSIHIPKVSQVARPLYLLLGVAFLLALVWWVWKRRWLGFWALWFLSCLLTVLPLSFHSYSWTPIAERYVYLSSIGFAVSISFFVFKILASQRQWVAHTSQVLLLVLLFTFGISTTLRTITWQSDLTLVQDALEKYPDSAHLNDAYARVLVAAGREEEAIVYWKKAIDLGRISYPAYSLGNIEKEKKNYAAAEKYYLQALWPKKKFTKKGSRPVGEMKLLHKRNPDIYLALVDLHWEMSRQEPERLDYHHERIIHFHQAACKVEPENAFLRYLLAKAYLRLGNLKEASKHFAEVQDMAPDTYYDTAAGKLMKLEDAS